MPSDVVVDHGQTDLLQEKFRGLADPSLGLFLYYSVLHSRSLFTLGRGLVCGGMCSPSCFVGGVSSLLYWGFCLLQALVFLL